MKNPLLAGLLLTGGFVLLPQIRGAVLVDDTWADGSRTDTSYPSNCAWYVSNPASTITASGFFSSTNSSSSASTWTTYFTAPGNPVSLLPGESLSAALSFRVTGSGAQNNSWNFRAGLFYTSAGTRLTTDVQPVVTNYTGYGFFSNFGLTWGRDNGMEFRYRIATNTSGILSSTGDYSNPVNGGTSTGTTAFTNNGNYTLTLTASRPNNTDLVLAAAYSGGGLTNALSTTYVLGISYLITNFDSFIIRPSTSTTTATNFIFTRFLVTVSNVPSATSFKITSITRPDNSSTKLTWEAVSNSVYQVQSRDALDSGSWITSATTTASSSILAYTNTGLTAVTRRYYRVVRLLP